jgi:hypothetical protein
MTKFASSAAAFAFIDLFVFMINYEFESRMSFDFVLNEESVRKRI